MDLRMVRYMMRLDNVILFMDMRGLDVYGLDLETSLCLLPGVSLYIKLSYSSIATIDSKKSPVLSKHGISHMS